MTDDVTVTRGSGNVFADLGLPNSEEELIKAKLIVELRNRIEELGITQTAAAKRMGVAQSDLSKLLKGRMAGFSLDRLFTLICALGTDVEIKLKPARVDREGHMRLMVA